MAKKTIAKGISKNLLFTNIGEVLTMAGVVLKSGRRPTESDLSSVTDAAMAVVNGKVMWVGPQKYFDRETKKEIFGRHTVREVNLKGRTVLPGFVECHTHLLFAGDRREEFEWRNQGITYQEISSRGGGIRNTMKATRLASAKTLLALGQTRTDRFVRQGVTTLEVKSGYGLDLESELKLLKVARSLSGPEIVSTFLGPHSLPPEFTSYDEYLDFVQHKILPTVVKGKLAERVDIFIERGFFTKAHAEKWFQAAQKLGLQVVAHTDQLSSGGGSVLAARHHALSVDHAVHLQPEEIGQLAKSDTTAVLLPTSDFYLQEAYPQARKMIDSGVRVALATDFNPGTSPSQNLSLVGVLARIQMKMSLAEVLVAYTYNAAAALGRQSHLGHLSAGACADFAVLSGSWRELFYEVGHHPINSVWRGGTPVAFS